MVERERQRIGPTSEPPEPGDAVLVPLSPRRLDLGRATGGGLALRLEAWLGGLADGARRDLDAGAGGPLLAAVFAGGAALYYLLPREPWWPAVLLLAIGLTVATVVRRRRGRAAHGGAVAAALACGVAVASLGTLRMAAPRLDHERTVRVEGRIADLDATAKGGTRLGIDVVRMEAKGLDPAAIPAALTATVTVPGPLPRVGEGVSFLARLKPPEGPVLPGGYDFARRAFFEGRGATGYVLGRVRPLELGPPPLLDRLLAPIGDLRHAIADRVRATLPGPSGTIGAAIMVGEQRAIPEVAAEPLRASGLTHIVSISGLHMALVAGGVIAAMRSGLALFPGLALRFAVKKWAAAAALLATTIYLLLSGNQVAALRSYLMLSVALVAVMVDRPAITLHTVAVAAVAIVAVEPWNVMEPSFLMSFLAVIALVASYDLWRAWQARRPPPVGEAALPLRLIGRGLRHVEGLAFSSLVAGLATAPVILGVFFRGAPYSIVANMIVMPVTGLVIMPAAVIAALAMPFGLDPWPLTVMGAGIDVMVEVGRRVAALPGGAGLAGVPHPLTMPLGIWALLWFAAWRSRLRHLALVPAIAAAVLAFAGPRPDVVIGRHAGAVAVRAEDGRLRVLAPRQDRFDVANWLAADADPRRPDDPKLAEGWRCDGLGCVYTRPAGARDALVVAVVRHPHGFDEDCRRADLVVTALVAPAACRERTEVIDRFDIARNGATTLTLTGHEQPEPAAGTAADPPDPTEPAPETDAEAGGIGAEGSAAAEPAGTGASRGGDADAADERGADRVRAGGGGDTRNGAGGPGAGGLDTGGLNTGGHGAGGHGAEQVLTGGGGGTRGGIGDAVGPEPPVGHVAAAGVGSAAEATLLGRSGTEAASGLGAEAGTGIDTMHAPAARAATADSDPPPAGVRGAAGSPVEASDAPATSGAAATAGVPAPIGAATEDVADADEVRPRSIFRIIAGLPAVPRPWTPVDPSIARLAPAEATADRADPAGLPLRPASAASEGAEGQ